MGELDETEQRLYWLEILVRALFKRSAPGTLEEIYQRLVDNNHDKEQLELFKAVYLEG